MRQVLCTYLPFELLASNLTSGARRGAAVPEISATILCHCVAAAYTLAQTENSNDASPACL